MINNSSICNKFGKTIFITGANSGIGFYSVIKFLETENYLYVPIRSRQRKDKFINDLKKFYSDNYLKKYLKVIDEIDLSNLENVHKLKKLFRNESKIFDIFILNAGLQYTGALYPKVSKQGIELTFAVNHLSHFYIINLLNAIIKDSSESRIVITSSDVHDPKSSGGSIGKKAGLNNLDNFKEEIMGSFKNFNADKSYKNSKLCNILFARELSNRLRAKKRKISVISWAPGLVFPDNDLGFFRYSSKFNMSGYLIFSTIADKLLGISESAQDAGSLLFKIAMEKKYNDINYQHLSNQLISFKKHKLRVTKVSEEALDTELAIKLWELSVDLCNSFGFTPINL